MEEVLTVTFNTRSPVFPRRLATRKKSPNRGIQHDHLRGEVSDSQDNSQARNIDSYHWWPRTYNPRGQQEYQELLTLLSFELCTEENPALHSRGRTLLYELFLLVAEVAAAGGEN